MRQRTGGREVRLVVFAMLAAMLATSAAQAQLDIERIVMTWCKDHIDGTPEGAQPWSFEIWVDLADAGTLDHIDVTKPAGATPFTSITQDDGDCEFDSPNHFISLTTARAVYPLGPWKFEFRDAGNGLLRTVNLDSGGLTTEPNDVVDFTYPSTNGQTLVEVDPTFTWTVGGDAGDALAMWVCDKVTDTDVNELAPAAMTTTSWAPGSLGPGRQHALEVSVLQVKDWVGPGFPTATVDSDQFEYALMIEYINSIEFN